MLIYHAITKQQITDLLNKLNSMPGVGIVQRNGQWDIDISGLKILAKYDALTFTLSVEGVPWLMRSMVDSRIREALGR